MLTSTAVVMLETKVGALGFTVWIDADLRSFFVVDTSHMFHLDQNIINYHGLICPLFWYFDWKDCKSEKLECKFINERDKSQNSGRVK